ncbi:MAG TPA: hypothetical protein VFG43_13465 [Geminicoccaceae bacterium]|nr:hypothetical protein [Geminicoccaceae bacterium]
MNLSEREYEIEGDEPFVREFSERLEALFQSLEPAEPPPLREPQEAAGPGDGPARNGAAARPSALGEFGDFIHRLPASATDVDRMLAAGFYVQQQSDDDAFGTSDANRRLVEQGVKIGNPSQCVRQSLVAKRVFMVKRGRFRVSQIGRQHLRQLMGPAVAE